VLCCTALFVFCSASILAPTLIDVAEVEADIKLLMAANTALMLKVPVYIDTKQQQAKRGSSSTANQTAAATATPKVGCLKSEFDELAYFTSLLSTSKDM
jgi:hypothetical protein